MSKSTTKTNRFRQFDSILSENRQLSHGGLPRSLAPATYIIGRYSWQSLAFTSFVLTSFLFLINPLTFIHLVKLVLLSS